MDNKTPIERDELAIKTGLNSDTISRNNGFLFSTGIIEKDENGLYIDNGKDSIKMYIELSYGEDETRTIEAEKIANSGIDSFMEIYSTASFHCTNISYHQETNNIKSITFSQVTN